MSLTGKYGFNRFDVSTTGFDTLSDDNIVDIEGFIETYLQYPISETVDIFEPVRMADGEFKPSWDSDGKWPPVGIAIEAGVSGETIRARRVGEITNAGWSLQPSGEVWLSTEGNVTQTRPGANDAGKRLGVTSGTTSIIVQL